MSALNAIVVTASDRPGMLSAITKVLADHQANISYVDLHAGGERAQIYFEFALDRAADPASPGSALRAAESALPRLVGDLKRIDGIIAIEEIPSFVKIYGKR